MPSSSRSTALDAGKARMAILGAMQETVSEQSGIVNACKRTLAQTIVSEIDLPPRGSALCDGYAAAAADTRDASKSQPITLGVLAESVTRQTRLQPETVAYTRKGDSLPHGADCVIDKTLVYRPNSDPEIIIHTEAKPGANVQPTGSIVANGAIMVRRGSIIGGHEMGLLASIGVHSVAVSRRPRVSVITSGASLVDITEDPGDGRQRNSARYALVGMILEAGCDLDRLIHVSEGRIGIEQAIASCVHSDAAIVALGPEEKHDIAVAALRNSGDVLFERYLAEPGSATAFAKAGKLPVFVLPGDAAMEIFETLIRPGLLTMLGRSEIDRPSAWAKSDCVLRVNSGYRQLIRAATRWEEGELIAHPLRPYSSDTPPWEIGNALIIVPENIDSINRGDRVEIMLL